jgi:hypothetical protein
MSDFHRAERSDVFGVHWITSLIKRLKEKRRGSSMNISRQKTAISHSEITELLRCPQRYHFHYRLGIDPECCPSSLLFSEAIREAVNVFHRARFERKRITLTELFHVFLDRWEDEQLPVRMEGERTEGQLFRKAERMLACYLDDPREAGEPVEIGRRFQMVISPELPVFVGHIDLVERSTDGKAVFTHFQVAGSERGPRSEELILYQSAVRQFAHPGAQRVVCRAVTLLKAEEPATVVHAVELPPTGSKWLVRTYSSAWERIKNGCSSPTAGWWCRQCPWANRCEPLSPQGEG